MVAIETVAVLQIHQLRSPTLRADKKPCPAPTHPSRSRRANPADEETESDFHQVAMPEDARRVEVEVGGY